MLPPEKINLGKNMADDIVKNALESLQTEISNFCSV